MAAPTVNSGHTTLAEISSVTSHVVDVPTHSSGDGIYIAIVCDGSQSFTFPAGFSKIISDTVTSSTATLAIARKTAGGSEGSTYTVTTSGSERAVAVAWSQSNDNGIDGTTPSPNTGSSATATCPSVTTTVANTLVLRVVGTDNESSTHSTVSGYTKIAEVQQASAGTISIQWIVQASAGSSGTADVTITSEQWAAATFAVAGVGGATYEESLTLDRSETTTTVVSAEWETGVSLGRAEEAIASGGLSISDDVALAREGGVTATGGIAHEESLTLGHLEAATAGVVAGWETTVSLGRAEGVEASTDFVNPIASTSIGYNARLLIADPSRKIMAEVQFAIEPISWLINDFGTTRITASRTDVNCTADILRPGNWLYVELDNGLPPWAGVLMPGRQFSSSAVSVEVTSAEHYLKRFHTDKGRYFAKATVGHIFTSVIGEANATWGMGVAIGEVWGGGTLHSPEYHLESIWSVVVDSITGRLENCEFCIEPTLRNGRIELTAHLRQQSGVFRPNVWFVQGHNLTEDEYKEVDELTNHWLLAGDDLNGEGTGWGAGRLLDVTNGINVESIGQYGLWQSSLIEQGIREQATLTEYARYLIGETATPKVMVCGSAVDKSPARFVDYKVGDTVRLIAPQATFAPLDTFVRVVGREFDFADGVCQVALSNV